jgi:NADH:ubiquinone oxidoreductase subunit 3 (subunit A)
MRVRGRTESTERRGSMLTILFLILLVALAIAGIAIASTAGSRRRNGHHEVPFESTKPAKPGRAPGLD